MNVEEENPWQTQEQKEVYNNPWIQVEEHQVTTPNGNPGIYGVVHFKNMAIGIVPLDEAGNTWLVGQYRYPLKRYSWEIPEGGCLIGQERPLEAAKRELQEETGLVAEHWTQVIEMDLSNSVTDEVGLAFVAQGLQQGAANPEDTEALQVRKISLEEAVEWCMVGKITDSLSIISLLATQRLLDQGKLQNPQ